MASEVKGNADYEKFLKIRRDTDDDFLKARSDKQFVWYNPDPKEKDDFATGEVVLETSDEITIKTEAGDERKLKKSVVQARNPERFDGVEDMSELSHLNEAGVLHNLRYRYNLDRIYTYSGLFLVAVNPFKRFPIYTSEIIEIYKGRRRNEVSPHIFAISDTAYRFEHSPFFILSLIMRTTVVSSHAIQEFLRWLWYHFGILHQAFTNHNFVCYTIPKQNNASSSLSFSLFHQATAW
eukprot:TRINITY_DN200_c0_g1_i6.p1 TRINITY_DN200_c0_g1~~TRINITY_DN200_c0_g1_i6.p1  ORF type:complete len:237 (-),score=42.76 TRINITY_DN200_c0_g1_i6:133-843(-)